MNSYLLLATLLPLHAEIVTCTVPPNLSHVMIVSDRKTTDGWPHS